MQTVAEGGLVRIGVNRVRGVVSSLTRRQLELLLDLRKTLTSAGFGEFLDLEWSFSGDDSLCLLQVRPATT
jgi:hypothetical protein